MQIRQLEYLVALARERHFARAAEACFVSQPALSEALQKLESELGVVLVKRNKSFEDLTPEGQRVLVWAQRILNDHASLQQEVRTAREGYSGTLRIGAVPAASHAVADLVTPFFVRNPGVRLRVEGNLPGDKIMERVRTFRLDAGLIYLEENIPADLRVRPLYAEDQVLLVDRQLMRKHHLPEQPGWEDVPRLPLCLLERSMRGRQLLDAGLAREGLVLSPGVEADSATALLAFVATGVWASVVSGQWLEGLGALPESTAAIPLRRLGDPQMVLVTHEDASRSAAMSALAADMLSRAHRRAGD